MLWGRRFDDPWTAKRFAPPERVRKKPGAYPVETAELGPLHLSLEHLHLVAQHEELDVPLSLLATSGSEETAHPEVQE